MKGEEGRKNLAAAEHVSEKLGVKTLPPMQLHFTPCVLCVSPQEMSPRGCKAPPCPRIMAEKAQASGE